MANVLNRSRGNDIGRRPDQTCELLIKRVLRVLQTTRRAGSSTLLRVAANLIPICNDKSQHMHCRVLISHGIQHFPDTSEETHYEGTRKDDEFSLFS